MYVLRWLIFSLALFLVSCDKPLPTLAGVDLQRWQQDEDGCGRIRISMRDAIDAEKEKLLSLNQMQIVQLLGKPDQNELSSRNQKFFYYFIQPGPNCEAAPDSTVERLAIRFNAVGLAKEVSIE